MPMPANGLWTVKLAVTRRCPVELSSITVGGGGARVGCDGRNDNDTLGGCLGGHGGSVISKGSIPNSQGPGGTGIVLTGNNPASSQPGGGSRNGDGGRGRVEQMAAASGAAAADTATTPSLVSQKSHESKLVHDPTDWVLVRIGPTLSALSEVASVKNTINDDLGEVRNTRLYFTLC